MSNNMIVVPESLRERFDVLVRSQAAKLRVSPQEARRLVEIALLQRGLRELEGEL